MDFTFRLELNEIIYGCTDNNALNYNELANVDDGYCEYNDCNTEYYTSNYGDMVLDCDGNCSPASWIGDGFCDDGSYTYNGNPIYFNCEEFNNDDGDCDLGRIVPQHPKYPNGRIPK